MNRRAFLTAIRGCLLASPLAAEAQARALRIGYLTSGGCPTEANIPLFLEGLQERGYVVGQNLVIECRHTEHLFKQATSYIDRILKGAKPDDLLIERPTRFYTAVNLKTAKALGLTLPPSLLARADEVVQ